METGTIIIGAGAAGLMAARELGTAGRKVVLLEARPSPGGRMYSLTAAPGTGFQQAIDAGAEFIHGALPITLQLLQEAGLQTEPVTGKMLQVKEGRLTEQENFVQGWHLLMQQMEALEGDLPLAVFLDRYFNGQQYEPLRRSVQGFAEGFDLADIQQVSTKALYDEWSKEEAQQYRVAGGYGKLVDYLYRQCLQCGVQLHMHTAVRLVRWQPGKVQVIGHNGQTYEGSQVLVTVPLAVLQHAVPVEEQLLFEPALTGYEQAAREIGYGRVIKIALQFKQPFWRAFHKDAGFLFTGGPVPTWWTQSPNGNTLLTGWVGNRQAAAWAGTDRETICRAGIQSLAQAFQLPENDLMLGLQAWEVIHWAEQPFIRGGYSYDTLATPAARQLLCTPIGGTLFFAGEALYEGPAPGTVEAALASGRQAARQMLGLV
jgi:monoamine oxidase